MRMRPRYMPVGCRRGSDGGRFPANLSLRRRAGAPAVREALFASRTGPPPAGMKAAVSPSPLDPVQWADPRTPHGSALPQARPERTGGRTATHPEHGGGVKATRTDNNLAIRNTAP